MQVESTESQATPPMNMIGQSRKSSRVSPAPMAAAANAPNPAATTISGASRERKRDKSAPPVTAPTPSEPSNRPYPRAPKSVSRPRTGISAITPAPQSMKRNVARRTRRNGGGDDEATDGRTQCSRYIDADTTQRDSCPKFFLWQELRYDRMPGRVIKSAG